MLPASEIQRAAAATTLHMPVWTDSDSVCCLADDERHLGHIVRADDGWLAFDATHLNDTGTSFRCLGCCATITQAKYAVEGAITIDGGTVPTVH